MKNEEQQIRELIREVIKDTLTSKTHPQRESRANQVQVEFKGIKHRKGNKRIRTFLFRSKHPQGSGKYWEQKVEIPDFRQISRQHKNSTLKERIQMATEAGDIKVYCSCPDWLYRFSFMGDAGNYGVEPQSIPPVETNPDLEGSLCKHLHSVLESIDMFYPEITKEFEKYAKLRKTDKR